MVELNASVYALPLPTNVLLLLLAGFMVFLMQAGFLLGEISPIAMT